MLWLGLERYVGNRLRDARARAEKSIRLFGNPERVLVLVVEMKWRERGKTEIERSKLLEDWIMGVRQTGKSIMTKRT